MVVGMSKFVPFGLVLAGTLLIVDSAVVFGEALPPEPSRGSVTSLTTPSSDRNSADQTDAAGVPVSSEPGPTASKPVEPNGESGTQREQESSAPEKSAKELNSKAALKKTAVATLEWHLDFAKAAGLARKQNKLLLLMFSAPNRCGSSKYIEQDMLRRERVKAWLASYYVCCKTNPDIPYGKALRQRYPQGRGVPTIIAIDGKGRALGALSGCNTTSEKFMAQIANISRGLPPGYGN